MPSERRPCRRSLCRSPGRSSRRRRPRRRPRAWQPGPAPSPGRVSLPFLSSLLLLSLCFWLCFPSSELVVRLLSYPSRPARRPLLNYSYLLELPPCALLGCMAACSGQRLYGGGLRRINPGEYLFESYILL